jgi:SRSO17 transposase
VNASGTRGDRCAVPFAWVAADSVYGVGDIEQALRRAGKGYVLGVSSNHHFGSWVGKPAVAGSAAEIAHDLDPDAWQRLSAGDGTKGGQGCTTGRIVNSPTSMPTNMTRAAPVCGHGVY